MVCKWVELHQPAETPEDEAEAAVGIQTDGNFSGRVQLTLQLHWPTEGCNCIMGHLEQRGDERGGRETHETHKKTNKEQDRKVHNEFKFKVKHFTFSPPVNESLKSERHLSWKKRFVCLDWALQLWAKCAFILLSVYSFCCCSDGWISLWNKKSNDWRRRKRRGVGPGGSGLVRIRAELTWTPASMPVVDTLKSR